MNVIMQLAAARHHDTFQSHMVKWKCFASNDAPTSSNSLGFAICTGYGMNLTKVDPTWQKQKHKKEKISFVWRH